MRLHRLVVSIARVQLQVFSASRLLGLLLDLLGNQVIVVSEEVVPFELAISIIVKHPFVPLGILHIVGTLLTVGSSVLRDLLAIIRESS